MVALLRAIAGGTHGILRLGPVQTDRAALLMFFRQCCWIEVEVIPLTTELSFCEPSLEAVKSSEEMTGTTPTQML
jgi:hypothetical protein